MEPEAEFRRLYEANQAAVHAYFVGRTVDKGLAADLMQEVFMRVWQRLPELLDRSPDGQRAWIFTVARNLSIDTFRRERSRAETVAAVADEPACSAPSTVTAVISAERLAIVGEAIGRLPEQQRTVLAMAAAGELTSTEIGTALGVPAGTVRYRLSEARRTLAAALAGYDHAETTEP
jgi:RNA polymerase sigma-70 factor, ECF subfamily